MKLPVSPLKTHRIAWPTAAKRAHFATKIDLRKKSLSRCATRPSIQKSACQEARSSDKMTFRYLNGLIMLEKQNASFIPYGSIESTET